MWPPNQSGSGCQPKNKNKKKRSKIKTDKIKKQCEWKAWALGHVSVVSATICDFPLVLTNLAIL